MGKTKYYDIELIDISENIENFKFTRVSEKHLIKIKESFKKVDVTSYLEFESKEGSVFFLSQFFRGLMFVNHEEVQKSIVQENKESSVEVQKIKIKKPVTCSMKGGKRD